MIGPANLKRLEGLVQQAAQNLKILSEDNSRLAKAKVKFEEENKRLREDLKRLSFAAQRQERLRGRLEKITRKLDKLESLS